MVSPVSKFSAEERKMALVDKHSYRERSHGNLTLIDASSFGFSTSWNSFTHLNSGLVKLSLGFC